jgi:peptidoglycan/LPS O-acetylase OafA/YrhL
LRAVAALLVFGNHLDLRGGDLGVARYVFAYGYTGVGFFFLLSGFVLAWSTTPGSSTAAFYVRRFARVYPSHVVMILVAVLVPVTVEQWSGRDIVVNALLMQGWLAWQISPYTLNGVSWSLSCEAAFYLVLPLLLPWARRQRPRTLWCAALLCWGLANAVTVTAAFTQHHVDAVYVFPPLRLGEFLLGVVLALQMRRGWRLPTPMAIALVVLGVVGMAATWDRFPAADVGAALVCLTVVAKTAQVDLQRPEGVLAHTWLVYAGQVSFAFYLVHELVILNVADLTGLRGWVLNPVALGASCLAAVALHHLVERPCEIRIRRLQLPSRQRVADRPVPFSG